MQPTQQTASQEEVIYGWRYLKVPDSEQLIEVPLTLEDVLHPQEGDVIPENSIHRIERDYITKVFSVRLLSRPDAFVTSDLLIDFDLPGLRALSPDVAVFFDLNILPDLSKGTFYPKRHGARCLFALEIISPHTRSNDVEHKVRLYHRAGVPLYVLVDQPRIEGPRELIVYRWTPKGYQREEVVDDRVPLPELGLRFALREGRTVVEDMETGLPVGDYAAIARDNEELQRRDQEREREIEAAIDRAHAAERQAREEARAREEALQLAQKEARAREEAERLAQQEARAREEAERELAALREQLRLLQGGDSGV